MITATVIAFIFFSLTGVPIAFALGLAGMAGILVGGFPMVQIAGKVVHSVDNFPLMSIPLFILAGELMSRGGIMQRIIDIANAEEHTSELQSRLHLVCRLLLEKKKQK